MIYCSSDNAFSEEERSYSTFFLVGVRHVKTWSINIVKEATLLRHVQEMPRINTSMHYIGGVFPCFPFYLEDEQLTFVSLWGSGAPKIWYVIPSSNKLAFEDFVSSLIIDREYLNEHRGGVRQIVGVKNLLFNSAVLTTHQHHITVRRFVQREGHFVILTSNVYHSGFKNGCNIAEAIAFANQPMDVSLTSRVVKSGSRTTFASMHSPR